MKAPLTPLFPLISAALMIVSCSEKPPNKTEKSDEDVNFYSGTEPTLSIKDLENELADGESGFLQSFAKDRIPWQKWNHQILEKATKAQLPVFVFVGSSEASVSRQVAREIDQNEDLRKKISANYLCTVVDSHLYPEIANLSFYLSTEISRSTAFPMAIWLSPEGSPLAWIPIGTTSGRELNKVITSASAMVVDIWQNSSRYAVENSSRDNEARQKRFNFTDRNQEPDPGASRDTVFQEATRQLSSFYSPGEKDLDGIGGLLPTSSLELLAIGSRSKLLTDEVRERCRSAAREVAEALMTRAMRDPLDGFYFFARKTSDWSLPSFSKTMESQARLASLFLKLGNILKDPKFTREGLDLLKRLETGWLAANLISLSSQAEKESPDTFLWSIAALKEILTKDELKLATHAFSLKKNGNIPIETDPLGRYYKLNSLRNQTSLAELATFAGEAPDTISPKLEQIRQKMLDHRMKNGDLISGKTTTLSDLIPVLKAQIDRSIETGKQADLKRCLETALEIKRDYWDPEKGLTRLPGPNGGIPARGRDYGAASLTFSLLYQHTLDQSWLSLATAIMDRALKDLARETQLISESPPEERIIPLRQHNISMIFGTSTLGFADQAAGRLFALTGNTAYQNLLKTHFRLATPGLENSVVNHTDFLLSCALGDSPLIAVLQGSAGSPDARELLKILNSPSYLPFLAIRPAESSPPLAPLPDLPAPQEHSSIILLRDNEIIGQASSGTELTALLDSAISKEE